MTELTYLVDAAPSPGTRVPVVDGIEWVYQPLPFRLDHVNCWWLDGGEGERVQVDTGLASNTTRDHWKSALQGARPDTLLVTHFHPDHSGLTGEMAKQGVALVSSEVEMQLSSRIWHKDPEAYGALYAEWYQRNGLDDAVSSKARAAGNSYRHIVAEPAPLDRFTWLEDEQEVALAGRRWRVLHGGGHAPAMLMLFDETAKVLIAADQVLPGISPNVSAGPTTPTEPASFGLREPDPLARFLATLERLQSLPADTLVLPSHGRPFHGLHARLNALTAHHEERLALVLDACTEPLSAADLFEVLFGKKLDAQQMAFALGESLAHADHLLHRGELECEDVAGIRRYRRV